MRRRNRVAGEGGRGVWGGCEWLRFIRRYFVKYLHTDPLLKVAAMTQNGVRMQILDRLALRSSWAYS
jgi:hypothetical protein